VRFSKSSLLGLVALLAPVACERESSPQWSEAVTPEHPKPSQASVEDEGPSVADAGAAILAGAKSAPVAIERNQPAACPEDMVLVAGEYCPEVRHECLRYLDPPGRYHEFRCANYGEPRCVSKARRSLRFCIDRDEYSQPGEQLPANHQSFTHAEKACAQMGKRVCRESEWNFACEGEEMRPYPYGFERDPSACNADRVDIVTAGGELRDLRAPADAFPRCVSPFGVRNLAGNLEEFVAMDGAGPPRPAMKGAYWQPSRNFCRANQTAHDRYYHGTETGFRCCADAPSP
jgi:formylglycine-generating enzyme